MLKSTLEILQKHIYLIAAAFLLYFFSAFGQTIFLGCYMEAIRDGFDLSQSGVSSLYAIGTLTSAFVVIWSGKYIDQLSPRLFITIVLGGLALGALILAFAPMVIFLPLAFFMLRHFGQGLMTLTGTTFINRYIDTGRGRAVSMASMGQPIHAMIFPVFGLWLAQYAPYQTLWVGYAAFAVCILIPLFWLLLGHVERTTHTEWVAKNKENEEREKNAAPSDVPVTKNWTRQEVLRDWRFYAYVVAVIIAPCFSTAIFFYQSLIADHSDVTPLMFASSFVFLTIASVSVTLISGFCIDKFGEKPVLICYPIVYGLGLFFLMNAGSIEMIYIAMAFIGAGDGMMGTVGGPLLAKMYGTKHFGSIKSLSFSAMIFSTSASPPLMGILLDFSFSIETILFYFLCYTVFAWLLLLVMLKNTKVA